MTNSDPPSSAADELQRLLSIMAALRTPGTGCPWDLEQTFTTIAPYTIEEAYEVADAIARGDLADLKDELGDLLLQVVYHARMAEEAGAFAFADVAEAVNAKMIRRHPHVFGTDEERAAGAQPDFWARIKAEETAAKAVARAGFAAADGLERATGRGPSASSLLSDIPLGLPALTRAVKLQEKAAKVGFDWPDLAPVFEKLKEEIAEFEDAARAADPRGQRASHPSGASEAARTQAAIEEELGDMLFVLANIARHLKLDPEAALRAANGKFIRRFAYIEARLAERGRMPVGSTLEEMDALWDEVRRKDKAAPG